jgi:hypothetical protein
MWTCWMLSALDGAKSLYNLQLLQHIERHASQQKIKYDAKIRPSTQIHR